VFPTSTIGPVVQIGDTLAFFTHGHEIGLGDGRRVSVGTSTVGTMLVYEAGADKHLPGWGLCVLEVGVAVETVLFDPVAAGKAVACKESRWVTGAIAQHTDLDGYEVRYDRFSSGGVVVVGDSGMAVLGNGDIWGIEYVAKEGTFWVQPWRDALSRC
jgi:hypothetical protein